MGSDLPAYGAQLSHNQGMMPSIHSSLITVLRDQRLYPLNHQQAGTCCWDSDLAIAASHDAAFPVGRKGEGKAADWCSGVDQRDFYAEAESRDLADEKPLYYNVIV